MALNWGQIIALLEVSNIALISRESGISHRTIRRILTSEEYEPHESTKRLLINFFEQKIKGEK